MEFRILGPLEIRDDDGRELRLGHGRERALLALLLLRANEVVSLDRIVDDLWGAHPPPTADKIVRNQISHLRRLVDGNLVTAGRGYRLAVPVGSLDADRFESLVAAARRKLGSGRAAEAADLLDGAISLWRGPPLEEFCFEPFAQGEIARLEELHAAATEDRLEAQLALGRHAEALPELERLVERHPLRERLRGQLMLALYRSGRQADALEQFRRARALLVEELGLEPTDELRSLERGILAHDPALALPGGVPPGQHAAAGQPRPAERDAAAAGPRSSARRLAVVGLVVLLAAAAAAAVRVLDDRRAPPAAVAGEAVVALDLGDGDVLGRVGVGSRPIAVAVGAGGVWVANAGDGTVSRIDPATLTVVKTIGVGVPLSDLAVGAGSVWTVSGSEGTLVRIDPRTNTPLSQIDLSGANPLAPEGAHAVAVGAGAVWVGSASSRVFRIDPVTEEVTAQIPVGRLPVALAVAQGDLWATLQDGRTVRIDTSANAVTGTVWGAAAPVSIAAGAGAVWVGDGPGVVWRVDPATASVTRSFAAPARPLALAVADGDVWAASVDAATLSRLDARSGKPVWTVEVGGAPLDAAVGDGVLWLALGLPSDR